MAELQIEFTRNVLSGGFYLGVSVLAHTDITLECLVATVGRQGNAEVLTRVATLNDLEGIAQAPSNTYQWLRDDGLAAAAPNVATDTVVFTNVPPLWTEQLLYVLGTVHTITAISSGDTVLRLNPPPPAFGEALSFELWRAGIVHYTGTLSGTAACHSHTPDWDTPTYYRRRLVHTAIPALVGAITKFSVLQTQAQSLVDNTEKYVDEYEGTDTEVYS